MDDLVSLATFSASWAVLSIAHNLADHVTGQTDWQSRHKAAPTREEIEAGANRHRGWGANLAHVALYHVTLFVLGALAYVVLPLQWSPAGILLAFLWSFGTHAILDRRWIVVWLLEHLGARGFAKLNSGGMNGVYASDQALHGLALGIAAGMLALI